MLRQLRKILFGVLVAIGFALVNHEGVVIQARGAERIMRAESQTAGMVRLSSFRCFKSLANGKSIIALPGLVRSQSASICVFQLLATDVSDECLFVATLGPINQIFALLLVGGIPHDVPLPFPLRLLLAPRFFLRFIGQPVDFLQMPLFQYDRGRPLDLFPMRIVEIAPQPGPDCLVIGVGIDDRLRDFDRLLDRGRRSFEKFVPASVDEPPSSRPSELQAA